jgi:hypothetical protein
MGDFPLIKNREVVFYPEDYGAVGDVRWAIDGSITSGTATLTSTLAAFTASDVGKHIMVSGAGASGLDLISTIIGVAGNVATLNHNAGTTVASAGGFRFGTDDSTAMQSCIDAALTAAMTQDHPWIILKGRYLVMSAPRTDRFGNCILSLVPASYTQASQASQWGIVNDAVPHIRFKGHYGVPNSGNFRCGIESYRRSDTYASGPSTTLNGALNAAATSAVLTDASSFPTTGAAMITEGSEKEVIFWTGKSTNTLTGVTRGKLGTTDATRDSGSTIQVTYGPPSIIGTATREQIGATNNDTFTGNIGFEDMYVTQPKNPTLAGIDLIATTGYNFQNVDVRTGTTGYETQVVAPSSPWAFGVRGGALWSSWNPTFRNISCRGYYAGAVLIHNDHMIFDRLYCSGGVINIAFSDPWEGGGGRPANGYIMSSGFHYYFAGWDAVNGAKTIPSTSNPKIWMGEQVVTWETAAAPIGTIAMVNDTNNMIYGKFYFSRCLRRQPVDQHAALGGRRQHRLAERPYSLLDHSPERGTSGCRCRR